ncbi:MAG TPA: TIGR00730 family Rossman fold protein [Tepidisphaeraceae bacterium]
MTPAPLCGKLPAMSPIRSVTVYCSSSRKVARVYQDATAELGAAIAAQGWSLVYGGNDTGLMGILANAARSANGKVIGVTPRLFVDNGVADNKCDELLVTDSMRDRKAIMEQRGDAFIALPGGLGTLEEWFEIVTGRQLKYHSKPVVLLNVAGFYDPLLKMIDDGIAANFVRPMAKTLFSAPATVEAAIEYIRDYKAPEAEPSVFTYEMKSAGE